MHGGVWCMWWSGEVVSGACGVCACGRVWCMVEWCGGACNVIGGGVVGGKWKSGWW